MKKKLKARTKQLKGEVCEPNPCENGGTCMTGLADGPFSCDCPEGFTDPNCSSILEVGACQPNPCHNGGTCEVSDTYRGDTFIGYICRCPDGFSGIHCQHSAFGKQQKLSTSQAFDSKPEDIAKDESDDTN
ncbi:hypothetical protein scyTo_0016041 [Scyliorhinus torazame]|uniref:EGF-like domain-containing protein n=1 Tax=Scyliorhinus torazame TaxID=75743 RepID=A0A401Q329_SCYTO|nr:hypothetical protein [Scyliorhinus torazame]